MQTQHQQNIRQKQLKEGVQISTPGFESYACVMANHSVTMKMIIFQNRKINMIFSEKQHKYAIV